MPFAQLDTELVGRVTNNALIVYALMKDRASYDEGIKAHILRYRIQTIAKMCNVSERCCKSCITELEECGLLTRSRTGRANFYIINAPERCTAPRGSKRTLKV